MSFKTFEYPNRKAIIMQHFQQCMQMKMTFQYCIKLTKIKKSLDRDTLIT